MSRVKVEFNSPTPVMVGAKKLGAGHCYRIVQANGKEVHEDTMFVDKYVIGIHVGCGVQIVEEQEPTYDVVAFTMSGIPILENDLRMFVAVTAKLNIEGDYK
jgi:hypothetical protein